MEWIESHFSASPEVGLALLGLALRCERCGRREWLVFHLAGQPRLYLQCVKCRHLRTADGLPSAELESYLEAVTSLVIAPAGKKGASS